MSLNIFSFKCFQQINDALQDWSILSLSTIDYLHYCYDPDLELESWKHHSSVSISYNQVPLTVFLLESSVLHFLRGGRKENATHLFPDLTSFQCATFPRLLELSVLGLEVIIRYSLWLSLRKLSKHHCLGRHSLANNNREWSTIKGLPFVACYVLNENLYPRKNRRKNVILTHDNCTLVLCTVGTEHCCFTTC